MNHWEISKLEEVTEKVGSGATPRGGFNSYKSSGIPLIRSMNVHFDGLRLEGIAYLDDKQADELKNVEVKADDVLLNITGASIGRVTQAQKELDGARVNQHVCIIRPIPVLDPKFLCKYLSSPSIQAMIMDKEYGGTRQALTKQMILEFDIPIPPVNEQRRIVAKIEALKARSQRVKKELEAIPALLDQFRQSALAAAFRGDLTADWREKNPDVEPASVLLERIRAERRRRWEEAELEKMKAQGKTPKDDKWKEKYKEPELADISNLPALPKHWCWVSIGELTAPGRPIIYGIIKPGPDTPGGVPYVRVTEMKTGVIDVSSLRRCHPERAAKFIRAKLIPGDILVSKDGTIGKVAIVPPELSGGSITQHVLRVSPSKSVHGPFLARMIEAPIAQKWMVSETKGMALQGINVEDFRRLPIPLPPETEQKVIEERLSIYWEHLASIRDMIINAWSQLEFIDHSILAKAFRGELVPQDPNDEPASVLLERIRAEREKLDTKKKAKGKTEKKSRKAKPEPAEPEQLSLPGFE